MRIALATLHVRPSAQATPLAAGFLAAALPPGERRELALIDLFPEQSDGEMVARLTASNPDLIAFSLYSWSRTRLLALARRLRTEHPSTILVAGGPEASADPLGVLSEGGLSGVIRGEGEETFRALLEPLRQGSDPSGLPGLTWQGTDGPVTGPDRPPAEDLEALPSPWIERVLLPPAEGGVLWEIARGCPFGCDFCFDGRGSRGVRHFSQKRLSAELDLFVRAGVSQVWVLDSTFNHPPERGKTLLRLLARKAPHLHYHLEAKADFLDRETARLLSRLDCSVQIGLQSARPEVLRRVHRQLDPSDFARKTHLMASEGVAYGFDLIYGLPGDDHRGFEGSLEFALGLSPNHLDLFRLAVLPGTPLHRQSASLGMKAQKAPPYELLSAPGYPAEELDRSRRLSEATDLFYNRGRAVAFFPPLLKASGLTAVPFLEAFARWAEAEGALSPKEEKPLPSDPQAILALQEGFIRGIFTERGKTALLPAALDLIRYHFNYAETLLGGETLPPPEGPKGPDPWQSPLRPSPQVRLVDFAYEIVDLLEMEEGGVDLEAFAGLFRPVGSTALFLRRGAQVVCESLEEGFLRLLRGCDGIRTPREIFAGSLSRAEGEEIVRFALAEGLVVASEKGKS